MLPFCPIRWTLCAGMINRYCVEWETMTDVASALALLKRGTQEILLEEELVKKLESSRPARLLRRAA